MNTIELAFPQCGKALPSHIEVTIRKRNINLTFQLEVLEVTIKGCVVLDATEMFAELADNRTFYEPPIPKDGHHEH